MLILSKIMGSASILLLICTIICGAWIRVHPPADIGFHFTLSISAVIVSLLTIVLFMFRT